MAKDDFLIVACGDAINLNFVKKFYLWYEGFGTHKDFQVRAEMDENRHSVIVEIFDNQDAAKECIKRILKFGTI